MRLVIADDSLVVRAGVRALLEDEGAEVVAEAGTSEGLLAAVRDEAPDAAVIDIRMPPGFHQEGLVAASQIRRTYPGVAVLVLSQHVEPAYALRLLRGAEGSAGYLLKDRLTEPSTLVRTLRRVVAGEVVVDRHIVEVAMSGAQSRGRLDELTGREMEVLGAIAEGGSNSELCARLFLSQKTVEAHITHIFRKLEIDGKDRGSGRVLAVLDYLRRDELRADEGWPR